MPLIRWSLLVGLFSIIASLALPAPARAEITPELYSEFVSLDENDGRSFEANARLVYMGKVQPYAGFSYLNYSAYGSSIERKSPLLGVRWQALPFMRIFAEYRVSYDSPSSPRKKDDPRLGLILGHWQEISELPGGLRLASDSYGELIYMNRYSDSPMAAGWSKLLVRSNPARSLFIDGFTEAYAQESRDPALGRKAQELRYGARGGWVGKRLTLSATVFRRFLTLVPAPAARYRLLFALGGSF